MFADYLIYIGFCFRAIPYIIRVYYNARPKFATVKASGIIHPRFCNAQCFYAGFHIIAQFIGVLLGAAATGVAALALVAAAENMMREEAHYLVLISEDAVDEQVLQEGDDKDDDDGRNIEPAKVRQNPLYRL